MRILWVKMGGLWPANTGGRVRSLQIISALSRRHRVTLVTTHGSGDDPGGLARTLARLPSHPLDSVCRPEKGRLPISADGGALVALARSGGSVEVAGEGSPRSRARSLVEDNTADVCIADFLFAAANVPLGGRVPVVLFEHNVEYLIWQRLSALESNPARRALFELEWRKLRRRERAICRRADLTIAVSERGPRPAGGTGARRSHHRRFRPASTRTISVRPQRPKYPAGSCLPDRWIGSRTRTR